MSIISRRNREENLRGNYEKRENAIRGSIQSLSGKLGQDRRGTGKGDAGASEKESKEPAADASEVARRHFGQALDISGKRDLSGKAAQPYIDFKSNANATGKDKRQTSIWKRMFHLYSYNQAEFMRHYHKRSNVETTFSMIKRKFGERLRSKHKTAQVNELLCKILCHNLCCVVHSIYELGIDVDFGTE